MRRSLPLLETFLKFVAALPKRCEGTLIRIILLILALRASWELGTPSSFLLSIFLEFGTGTRIVGRVRTPILLA